jgi:hypothetical protein
MKSQLRDRFAFDAANFGRARKIRTFIHEILSLIALPFSAPPHREKDEGGRMKDESEMWDRLCFILHPSSFILLFDCGRRGRIRTFKTPVSKTGRLADLRTRPHGIPGKTRTCVDLV